MPPDGELYIRYSATDNGGRDIPANQPHYMSPAIAIVGGIDAGTAVANVDQLIRVKVGNLGSNARTDVMVQVFATNFGTVNPWLSSLGGPAGRPGGPFVVPANAAWQTDTEGQIEIGWRPSTSDLGGETLKHMCLFANVHRPGDGAPMANPPDFHVRTNQHHAQRNIKLAATRAGGRFRFAFKAANMELIEGTFVLEVTGLRGKRTDAIDRAHMRTAAWLAAATKKLGRPMVAQPPPGRPILLIEGGKGPRLEVDLAPGEDLPVEIDAGRAPKEPGLYRFAVVQRSVRTGEVLGGARVIAAVLPDELIPEELARDPDLPKA